MSTVTQAKRVASDKQRITDNIHDVRHRIAVLSGKGGVGKTTISVNLAFALRLKGMKAGILDADVTGPNVAKMLGIDGELRLENRRIVPWIENEVKVVSLANALPPGQPVIWRGPMRSRLLQQFLGDVEWGKLDYLVADLPPGTGDEIITIAQEMKPDLAIVVTTPQEVSLMDSRRAINMARKMDVPKVALIENMSGLLCPQCGERIDLFGRGGGQKQALEESILYLGALPIDIDARRTSDEGRPIVMVNREAQISAAFRAIADEIDDLLDRETGIVIA